MKQFSDTFHRTLTRWNGRRLEPTFPDDALHIENELQMREFEENYLAAERTDIAPLAELAPLNSRQFVEWFEALRETGPGQGDPLFPWLAEQATMQEMRWFLGQEVAGEAGFDDLLAMAQVRFPDRAKLEMARNFWDEMGQGHASGMHGPMLARLARELDVVQPADSVVAEAMALGNLMVAMCANRRYAYHGVGALGVIELTAPGRSEMVNRGLKRLGVEPRVRQYFALHATLDKKHSAAWNQEVLQPLVDDGDPRVMRALAEGALLRLAAGARCFERYRRELGLMVQSEGSTIWQSPITERAPVPPRPRDWHGARRVSSIATRGDLASRAFVETPR